MLKAVGWAGLKCVCGWVGSEFTRKALLGTALRGGDGVGVSERRQSKQSSEREKGRERERRRMQVG